jgi:RNA polymerase sigma factor (sigma-70 family)
MTDLSSEMTDLNELAVRAVEGDRAALDALVEALRDDIYRLSLRMLGLRADAEDAAHEILLKILTHLSEFRGESSLRTWAWRIATRHLVRRRKSRREEVASFETIEAMIAFGDQNPPLPELPEQELALLAEEVRLACTQAMVLSLDRDLRVAWILADVFELQSDEAARVLDIEPAAFRKRASRARSRLAAWMKGKCGLVNDQNACRCRRQVPVAMSAGVAVLHELQYADHPGRQRTQLRLVEESLEIEAAVSALRDHVEYAAPATLQDRIRELLDSGRYRILEA